MILPSIFSVFKIGIGPSSSHTIGALKSAQYFKDLVSKEVISARKNFGNDPRLQIELLGSFAHTGIGHLTNIAAVAGLEDFDFLKKDTGIRKIYETIEKQGYIKIKDIILKFDPAADIKFNYSEKLLKHPNTIRFYIFDGISNEVILSAEYLSVGGGIVIGENVKDFSTELNNIELTSLAEIIEYCKKNEINLVDFVYLLEKENYGLSKDEVNQGLNRIWQVMSASIEKGLENTGVLPGDIALRRKAKELFTQYKEKLREWSLLSQEITLSSIYAIAVSEENANGGTIVTAPTCGSAGIIPAVLKILQERFRLPEEKIYESLMIAGLIGSLVMANASISGAEVGCQGEIGTACAMGAAAVSYLLNGTAEQIEFAAEIALEHSLGLTCDPLYGLVQIPCIERNGVGAVKAMNAANLALLSKGEHQISFDDIVQIMKQVGQDMNMKYKETALGGIAQIPFC